MLTAAFLFEIILASIVVASTSASFPRCVSCPCGSGSQNYTHCIDESLLKDFSCERWSYCQTCKANTTFCITCPPDRFGPTCSENTLTRRKRQDDPDRLNLPRYPRQSGSCPFLERPESGSIRCSQTGNERYCTSRCLPGFHFEGEENVNEITLRCRGNVWTPRSFFPPCSLKIWSRGKLEGPPERDEGENGVGPILFHRKLTTISGGHCEVEVTGAGSYNCTTDMEGTHCDITCDSRYQGTFHCYPGRPWAPPLPFCTVSKVAKQRTTCADPGIPRDGRRINPDGSDALNPRMFQEGESVIFTCNGESSALQGKSFITCLADGSWSAPRPQCISFRVDGPPAEVPPLCPLLEVNPNVEVEELFALDHQKYQGFEAGEELTFSCKEGHDLEGPSVIKCLGNGRWSSPPPTCNPKSRALNTPPIGEPQLCPVPEVDPNGEVQEFLLDSRKLTQGFEPGTELTIRCKEGYILQGWGTIRCSNNGLWSTPSPKCNFKPRSNFGTPSQTRCVNPGYISNGRVDVFPPFDDPSQPSGDDDDFEFPLGTHLKFTCEEGFSLVGDKDSMSCESNGYWSGSKPICSKDR